ncbi:MAG: class B sortase [Coriobacteriia bacterium]|nr:class B sortase [Coriobacteriia bacterium]
MVNNEEIKASHASTAKVKKKRGFLFWASLTVMIAALIALGIIGFGYLEGCMMYRDISDDAFDDGNLNLADMKVDWDALLKINPETVAWVYIPGTPVNYPVVHTTDNEKYLHTNFRGYTSYVSYGAIFMDCNNKHDLSDQNIVTYGHNMNDGSMYAVFRQMKDSNVFNQNRNIYFLTPKGNYRLKSFSLCHVNAEEKIIQTNFGTEANKVKYITDKINRCIVDVDGQIPDPAAMTKIFTFSTCDNTDRNYRDMCFAYVAESTVDGVPGLE